jgi:hypothetical protein
MEDLDAHGTPLYLRGITVSLGPHVRLRPLPSSNQGSSAIVVEFATHRDASVLSLPDVFRNGGDRANTDWAVVAPLYNVSSFDSPGFGHVEEGMLQRTATLRRRVAASFTKAWLFPALLVYDPHAASAVQGYQVRLPADPQRRADSILKAYVLDYVLDPTEVVGRPH